MSNIRTLVQDTLDQALGSVPVYAYWLRRQEVEPDPNPDEYVVYSFSENETGISADGVPLILESFVTLRYFCRNRLIIDGSGQECVENRLRVIRSAFVSAGFDCPRGWQNVGDVDGISYETFVLEISYQEVAE